MRFEFYKSGHGYYTRMGTAIGSGIMLALGCWALYESLGGIRTENPTVKSWLQAGIPAVVFAVLGGLIFKLVNMPRFADFLIQTEGEMKKVSWSSKKEIITSTKVVIITVILMAAVLALIDISFAKVFEWIGVLKVMAD